DGELGVVEVRILDGTQARVTTRTAGHFIDVGKDDLVAVTVGTDTTAQVPDEVEPQTHGVSADHEVADLAGEAIAPVGVGAGPFSEAPVARHAGGATNAGRPAELVQLPAGGDVGHEFDIGRGFL